MSTHPKKRTKTEMMEYHKSKNRANLRAAFIESLNSNNKDYLKESDILHYKLYQSQMGLGNSLLRHINGVEYLCNTKGWSLDHIVKQNAEQSRDYAAAVTCMRKSFVPNMVHPQSRDEEFEGVIASTKDIICKKSEDDDDHLTYKYRSILFHRIGTVEERYITGFFSCAIVNGLTYRMRIMKSWDNAYGFHWKAIRGSISLSPRYDDPKALKKLIKDFVRNDEYQALIDKDFTKEGKKPATERDYKRLIESTEYGQLLFQKLVNTKDTPTTENSSTYPNVCSLLEKPEAMGNNDWWMKQLPDEAKLEWEKLLSADMEKVFQTCCFRQVMPHSLRYLPSKAQYYFEDKPFIGEEKTTESQPGQKRQKTSSSSFDGPTDDTKFMLDEYENPIWTRTAKSEFQRQMLEWNRFLEFRHYQEEVNSRLLKPNNQVSISSTEIKFIPELNSLLFERLCNYHGWYDKPADSNQRNLSKYQYLPRLGERKLMICAYEWLNKNSDDCGVWFSTVDARYRDSIPKLIDMGVLTKAVTRDNDFLIVHTLWYQCKQHLIDTLLKPVLTLPQVSKFDDEPLMDAEMGEFGIHQSGPQKGNPRAKLNQNQIQVSRELMNNGIVILTGPPGTGKSEAVDLACRCFPNNVVVGAFTGKAMSNLKKRVEDRVHGATLHSQLFKMVERVKPVWDLVVIDEASMVTEQLWMQYFAILRARRILIVGDPDQLIPHGWFHGAVLRELVQSRIFPTIILTENYRQQDGRRIIDFGQAVLQGGRLSFDKEVIRMKSYDRQLGTIIQDHMVKSRFRKVKFLCFTNRIVRSINEKCVRALYPKIGTIFQADTILNTFHVGDEIIFRKNVYRDADNLVDLLINSAYYARSQQIPATSSSRTRRQLYCNGESVVIEAIYEILDQVQLEKALIESVLGTNNKIVYEDLIQDVLDLLRLKTKGVEELDDDEPTPVAVVNLESVLAKFQNQQVHVEHTMGTRTVQYMAQFPDSEISKSLINYNTRDRDLKKTERDRSFILRTSDKRWIWLNDSFDHAYALTVHRAQGESIDEIVLCEPSYLDEKFTSEKCGKHSLFTAVTRARHSVTFCLNGGLKDLEHMKMLVTPEVCCCGLMLQRKLEMHRQKHLEAKAK